MAQKVKVDFSDVESRGGKKGSGGRKHYPPADYHVKCVGAKLGKSGDKETPRVEVTYKIVEGKYKGGQLRDDLYLTPKSLWRLRQTLEAMGMKIPNKAVGLDVDNLKGKELAVTLDDDEYNDTVYSKVVDAFTLAEFEGSDDEDVDDVDDDDDEEDDEDEDDDEDTDDEDEDEDLEEVDLEDI